MAHGTRISGVNKAVTTGFTRIDGVSRKVKKGLTLINGVQKDINFAPDVDPVLGNNTPEQIRAAAQSGQAANYWSVGDMIGIPLFGTVGSLSLNATYYAFILGFDHNSDVEGAIASTSSSARPAQAQTLPFVTACTQNTTPPAQTC